MPSIRDLLDEAREIKGEAGDMMLCINPADAVKGKPKEMIEDCLDVDILISRHVPLGTILAQPVRRTASFEEMLGREDDAEV